MLVHGSPFMQMDDAFGRWRFVVVNLGDGTLIDAAPDLRAARSPVNLALASGAKRLTRVEQFCNALQSWCDTKLRVDA